MDDVFDEATWRETINDDDHDDAFPWMKDSQACPDAVITAMVDHAPPSLNLAAFGRGWSVADAARVAAACRVTYEETYVAGIRHGAVSAFEKVAIDYIADHYPGAESDAIIGFDSTSLDKIGGNLVDAENESGRSVWIDCDECGNLHHFDGAMVRGETTPLSRSPPARTWWWGALSTVKGR